LCAKLQSKPDKHFKNMEERDSTINSNMQNLYRKYRDYILCNKSIFIAGICAFLAAAYVTQASYLTYNKSNITNSIVGLTTEYGVYLPIFCAVILSG
jgi:hypothetical protein